MAHQRLIESIRNVELTKNQKIIGGTVVVCGLSYLTYTLLFKKKKERKSDAERQSSSQPTAFYEDAIINGGASQYDATRVDIDYFALLGETPLWDDTRQLLIYVDETRNTILEYDPSAASKPNFTTHVLPEKIGSFALCDEIKAPNCYLVALENGIHFYDYKLQKLSKRLSNGNGFEKMNKYMESHPHIRFNDGKCDRDGNFIVGGNVEDFWDGMELDDPFIILIMKFFYRMFTHPRSSIYRINGETLTCDELVSSVFITNSISFSLDNTIMYFTDSLKALAGKPCIRQIKYNSKLTPIDEPIVDDKFDDKQNAFTKNCHTPDGSCIDSDDCLWNAHCTQGKLCRYNKHGEIDMIVNVPDKFVTCPGFGGKNLDTMYITTLNMKTLRGDDRTEEEKKHPTQGALYSVKIPNVKGVKEPRFSGSCQAYF